MSDDIIKAGLGLVADIMVVWNDLGENMNNLVDCGLMARLLLAEKYNDTSFANLSLEISIREILGFTVDKESQRTNWKSKSGELTPEQKRSVYFRLGVWSNNI